MIYEIALLPVHHDHVDLFRRAFANVVPLLTRAKGYRGHLFAQGIENPRLFNLIVRWQSLEDHTHGFEATEDHRLFMMGLEQYLSDEPRVYHIEGAAIASEEHDDGASSNVDVGNASTLRSLWP